MNAFRFSWACEFVYCFAPFCVIPEYYKRSARTEPGVGAYWWFQTDPVNHGTRAGGNANSDTDPCVSEGRLTDNAGQFCSKRQSEKNAAFDHLCNTRKRLRRTGLSLKQIWKGKHLAPLEFLASPITRNCVLCQS